MKIIINLLDHYGVIDVIALIKKLKSIIIDSIDISSSP